MISVAIYNRATVPLPFAIAEQVAAMQRFCDECFSPIWQLQAKLSVTDGPVAGSWGLVFMDTADSPGALAYHDEENNAPLSKVFVKTTLAAAADLSVSASHELLEMLVDSACNRFVTESDSASPVWMSFEAADPVEDQFFPVGGFNMSNFVTPDWFDPQSPGPRFDYLHNLTKPFELSAGGYAVTLKDGQWSQRFGSDEKAMAFSTQDRRGRRGWFRTQAAAPV